MANSLTTNPIVIDTVAADVELSVRPMNIKAITFYSTDALDVLVLADVDNVPIAVASIDTAGGTVHQEYFEGYKTDGKGHAKVDLSASTLAGTFLALIYV